jgi:hypothetical protein
MQSMANGSPTEPDRAFVVRRATSEDAAELADIAELTFTETFGHLYPPADLSSHVAKTYTPGACLEVLADPRMAYWLVGAEVEPAVGFALAGYCKLPLEDLEPTAGVGEYDFPVGKPIDHEFILKR